LVDDAKFKEHLNWEIKTLMSCDCPNIVKYHGVFHKDSTVHIILEYMDKGSLESILKEIKQINEIILGEITC